MAWKIERWLAEVFPGETKIYQEYRGLPPRELAIISAAVLDSALVEIIALRLGGPEKEVEAFLGADGDSRAPVGSFGARIQLALLLGIITEQDAEALRAIKQIRNLFAHRTTMNFLLPQVLKQTQALLDVWEKQLEPLQGVLVADDSKKRLAEIRRNLTGFSEAGEGLLLAVLTTYQAYFHRIHGRIEPLNAAIKQPRRSSLRHTGHLYPKR